MFPEAPSATKLSLENTWDLNHGSLFPGKVSEQLYKQRMDSLTEFLRTKRFPYDVRKRVRGFYMHLYANKVRRCCVNFCTCCVNFCLGPSARDPAA